jgi:hypothetical protein
MQLKREVQLQKTMVDEIEKSIDLAILKKKTLKIERERCDDPRRRVLDLKSCMTCTPEMDVVLST